MQGKIAALFIGLILLAGSPLAMVSFVDACSHAPHFENTDVNGVEVQTIRNADSPIQQGDIRNLKHTSQKIRISKDDLQPVVGDATGFSGFIFSTRCNGIYLAYFKKTTGYSPVPLFILHRKLII